MSGMEAAVASAAASGILKIVVNKLAPLLIEGCLSVVGVNEDLRELKALFDAINNQLEAAGDRVTSGDAPFSNYCLKQLKDVAYDLDDVVNEFHLEAENLVARGDDGIVSKYMCSKPKSFKSQCKVAWKIKAIKKRFDAIVKQIYALNEIKEALRPATSSTASHSDNTTMGTLPEVPQVTDSSVIGRGKDKNYVISKLLETSQQNIMITSIIGLGGSGKTTLANLVFNDAQITRKFEHRFWVHVSQEFDVEKLLKKLFEAIPGEKSTGQSLDDMVKKISDKLTEKFFLLVLDDVWNEDEFKWIKFMKYVNNGAPGSRILVTTRNSRVADAVESTVKFNLPLLSDTYSWQLFEQTLGMAVKDLGSEFLDVGKAIVEKCGGVPLAIIVLACVLHRKKRIEEWCDLRDSNALNFADTQLRVYACLWVSYFNLPFSDLKRCFTICSLFPKGHCIDRDQLIGLWIAHDMITREKFIGRKIPRFPIFPFIGGAQFLAVSAKFFGIFESRRRK